MSVPGLFPLHKNVTKARSPVTYGNLSRFPDTHGYVTRFRSPVPGYAGLRESVTKPGSRLHMVT